MGDKDFKIVTVIEQKAIFDGEYLPAIDDYLLMKIVNHNAAEDDDEIAEMETPKRYVVRVTIEVAEAD